MRRKSLSRTLVLALTLVAQMSCATSSQQNANDQVGPSQGNSQAPALRQQSPTPSASATAKPIPTITPVASPTPRPTAEPGPSKFAQCLKACGQVYNACLAKGTPRRECNQRLSDCEANCRATTNDNR
ncbi:MAG TPA: hypothetical protein VF546_09235 [Pyrinomonadaceae bacterium]|jgi:hypothetical protein